MIYIAAPYSDPAYSVRNARANAVTEYAHKLMAEGHPCFSPITYGHVFACRYPDTPLDAAYWWQINQPLLLSCTAIHVLGLRGVSASLGVRMEIDYAMAHNIPVEYIRHG